MENRLHKIACRIQKEGSVRARDLAEEFGVSMETIRKDLARLETEGVVRREYGAQAFEKRKPDRAVGRGIYREDPCGCLCAWLFGCPACAGADVPLLHRDLDEEENDGSG